MIKVCRPFCYSLWLVAAVGCSEDPGGVGPRATRIVVTPGAASVRHGDTLRLRAEVYDARDRLMASAKVVWTARDTLAAIVSEDGLVYGRAPGSGMLSVRSGTADTQVGVSVSAENGGWRSLGTYCGIWGADSTFCWYWNNDPPFDIVQPVLLTGVPSLQRIRFGLLHACGLTFTGAAYCWGENIYGQVGDGSTFYRPDPVPVAGGLRFDSVTVGALHGCAITALGQAYCWGVNSYGQLGVGTAPETCNRLPCSRTPVAVAGSHRFRAISAGGDESRAQFGYGFTCALSDQGKAYCWGQNDSGALGDGTRTSRNTPVEVISGDRFVAITTGSWHTCALTEHGEINCWGSNWSWSLGTSPPNDPAYVCGGGDLLGSCSSLPLTLQGRERYRAISAGYGTTCALNTMGAAFCWGYNFFGNTGSGATSVDVRSPTRVVGGHTYIDIKTGVSASCGLTPTRSVMCWGNQLPRPQFVPEPERR